MDGLQLLPLAITMVVGPQIMSAIVFVTTPRPVRVSLGFLAGVALAAALGVAVMRGLAALLGGAVPLSGAEGGRTGDVLTLVFVGLLVAAALRNWLRRETAEPPKWLGNLLSAGPRKAFTVGLASVLLMPSDLMVMATVGLDMEREDASPADALPFIGLTVLLAALPLLARLVFHRRAEAAMPRLREWIDGHSWVVNIAACGIFAVLVLTG